MFEFVKVSIVLLVRVASERAYPLVTEALKDELVFKLGRAS